MIAGFEVSSVLANAVDLVMICLNSRIEGKYCTIGQQAVLAIKNYLYGGRPQLVKDGSGRNYLEQRELPFRKMVWVLVKDYASGRNRENRLTWIASSFATIADGRSRCTGSSGNVGHADVGTTQIYTHVESQRLMEEHANFHPLSG